MTDTDLGNLNKQGDRYTLTYTRHLPHPPEKVWRAVTEPAHLAAWFPDNVVGEFKEGAVLRFENEHGDGFDGKMLAFDPPSRLELLWGTDQLRIELQPDGDGTVLTFVDTFDELGKAARDGAGWHECIARLVAHVVGREPAPWGAHWREFFATYADHLGPEASTQRPPPGWEPPTN
jgi:uncharacterized protein YndB with AHSA1/START domain